VPPYVSPRIERSNERQDRAAVPVLPVIFRFDPAPDLAVHPGQLVDVFIAER
jgi:HlyD family secretion protein